MRTAEQIVLVYGTSSVAAGMALGLPLSQVRMRRPVAPRHLVTAHLAALIQGAIHLGLSVAIAHASLPSWVLTGSACALVAGSALFVAGATSNWLRGVGDHFAERSAGWYLLSASGPLHLVGAAAVLAGVLNATVFER